MTFGQRLKELMEERNMTQRQLSKELNIAVSTINGYANNYREPDYFTLISIAKYFDVSTDYLLGITVVPKRINSNNDTFERLLYYYEKLNPDLQELLLDQAKTLYKHNDLTKKS